MYFLPHARKDTKPAAPPVMFAPHGDLRPNGGKIGASVIAAPVAGLRSMSDHIFG
jgi:hypothetical protein